MKAAGFKSIREYQKVASIFITVIFLVDYRVLLVRCTFYAGICLGRNSWQKW